MIQQSWISSSIRTGDTSSLCTSDQYQFPSIARIYSKERPHRQLGNWEDGPWFLSPLQRGGRLQFAAGRDSFQPTRCLWQAQWPARSGTEDERDTPSILTVALCDVFKARRVTTWLNRWGAARDFFSAAFWNSCGRTLTSKGHLRLEWFSTAESMFWAVRLRPPLTHPFRRICCHSWAASALASSDSAASLTFFMCEISCTCAANTLNDRL